MSSRSEGEVQRDAQVHKDVRRTASGNGPSGGGLPGSDERGYLFFRSPRVTSLKYVVGAERRRSDKNRRKFAAVCGKRDAIFLSNR